MPRTFLVRIALLVLLGQGVVTTQVDSPRPAFAAASVRAIDPPTLDHTGRQQTITTFYGDARAKHRIPWVRASDEILVRITACASSL